MVIPQPLISVNNVKISRQWYQETLGLESGHGGDEYERLMAHGNLVLQLHRWDVHDHPYLGSPAAGPNGHGVAIWFQTDEFDQAMARITASKAEILEGPMINQNAQHREVWLRDPDGYVVVVAGGYGDLGER